MTSAAELESDFKARYPTLSIHLTGGASMMRAFFDAAKHDASTLMVVVVAVLSIGLVVFLGGIVPALLMLLLGTSSVLITLGIAGWFGHTVNTATATVPLIVFTLVVASSMHVFHILRENQLDSKEAVARAARTAVLANWRPVVLTVLTTAVGLLSMMFVSAPPLRELGVLSAIGVTVGGVLVLTVIPCLFGLIGKLKVSDHLVWLQNLLNTYAKWLERRRPRMVLPVVLFGAALIGLPGVTIDEDFVRIFRLTLNFVKTRRQ